MSIKYISSKQMAKVDKVAVESFGLKIEYMMENAGRNFARFVYNTLKPKRVLVLYGKGNNGGDGLCAARHLSIYGSKVTIVGASRSGNKHVKAQLKILKKSGIIPKKKIPNGKFDVIVDALLGYNIKGNPRGKFADLINAANRLKKKGSKIVSYDLPSGLNPDSAKCYDPCIMADYTLTLALPKIGLKKANVGKLYLVNLGIPNALYKSLGIKIGRYFSKSDVIRV